MEMTMTFELGDMDEALGRLPVTIRHGDGYVEEFRAWCPDRGGGVWRVTPERPGTLGVPIVWEHEQLTTPDRGSLPAQVRRWLRSLQARERAQAARRRRIERWGEEEARR